MDQNVNINVRTIGDHRGRNFLIGAAIVFLLFRWWLTGSIAEAVHFYAERPDLMYAAANPGEPVPFSATITGTLLPILAECVIVLGAVAAALVSGLWYLVYDFALGLWEMFQIYRTKQIVTSQAVSSATQAATEASMQASIAAATASGTYQAVSTPQSSQEAPELTLERVAGAVQKAWNAGKSTGKTVEELQARLLEITATASELAIEAAEDRARIDELISQANQARVRIAALETVLASQSQPLAKQSAAKKPQAKTTKTTGAQ